MKISRALLSAFIALSFTACNEKNTPKKDCVFTDTETKQVPDTIRMNKYTNTGNTEVKGNTYNYSYEFSPSDSLSIVTNSSNQKYYDNHIKLTITKEGHTIYSKTFTKSTFKQFISPELYETIVLMGFNFNYNKENERDKFYFVASVGDPDDEEFYIPIDISITTDGKLSLNKFIDNNGSSNTQTDAI